MVQMNKWKAIPLTVMMIFLLAACIKIPIGDGNKLDLSKDGITVIGEDGNEVSISKDDDESFTISGIGDETGEDGELSFGNDLDVPEVFPKDLPMPKDANIVIASKIDEGAMMQYISDSSLEELEKMYKKYFESGDFQEKPEVERMDTNDMAFVVYSAPYDDRWLSVYMSRGVSSEEQSEVAITLERELTEQFEE